MSLGWRRRRNGRSCDLMAIDFAAVFRVLVTLFGITALLSAIVGLVSFFAGGAELLLGVALVSAILSLAFRLPARAAGGHSRDRVSSVASWIIGGVLGSLAALLLLLIWDPMRRMRPNSRSADAGSRPRATAPSSPGTSTQYAHAEASGAALLRPHHHPEMDWPATSSTT